MTIENLPGWRFWVDRGGTFTDVVALGPEGEVVTRKLLSENPRQYADACVAAVADVISRTGNGAVVDSIKIGTTIGTNALLERKGERVLLVTTKGFADAIRIGYQNRPRIFALNIVLPQMLYSDVLEVAERVSADGEVLLAPDEAEITAQLAVAREKGFDSCAIVFLHGYCYPQHEEFVEKLARQAGFRYVSRSSEVSPLQKYVSRGDTTLCDAYLSPLLSRYIEGLRSNITTAADSAAPRLLFMQSNGGLADAQKFRGKDSILSGPAGGIVGAVKTAANHGFDRIISFDMGGTSTDVSHYAGELEHVLETVVAGVRLRAPMLDIHTVAAGGGSILRFDGARMLVGPESAGAQPGPTCYRQDGPLTVTDANVLLGKIQPDYFPQVFGEQGDQPIDVNAVRAAFSKLSKEVEFGSGKAMSPEQIASDFLSIAVTKMANAIKHVSIARGHDVSSYVLVAFGGAGGQHACLIAESLGIEKVLLSPLAGVLSAVGIGLADILVMKERSVNSTLAAKSVDSLAAIVDETEREAREALLLQLPETSNKGAATVEALLLLKYAGTDSALPIRWAAVDEMRVQFLERHRQRYGFDDPDKEIIVEAISVTASGAEHDRLPGDTAVESGMAKSCCLRQLFSSGRWHDVPVYVRESLPDGCLVAGPAIIAESTATTIVEEGWQAERKSDGCLLLSRVGRAKSESVSIAEETADPARLELFNNLFMFIAEQMGLALQNTSHSVNIKERLDFSCALFDHCGNLVANAPHIPVHLGSMGESVESLINSGLPIADGDVFAINDPYAGGTHLPDITVITPVFAGMSRPQFFVASRGHHADVGGKSPGSMPSDSTNIFEEGILFHHFRLVENGVFRDAALRDWLVQGEYPARNPDQNVADMKAQIAANARGAHELMQAVEYWGLPRVSNYMRFVQDNACESVRRVIDKLSDGSFTCRMDDDSTICVKVEINRKDRSAVIDFSGTSAQHSGNLNAPFSVCKAAVLYVFRTLVSEDIPLNAGCFRPLELRVPEGSMLNPQHPAAVVAGNVETSQAIVDALYAALGVLSASQGTMNNFTFGNSRYQYYETICGGAGAGADFDGADAVHTHMTNSRLTDPEVLESRFPVRLESFGIRRGSGGAGKRRGGDGVVRKLLFLESMSASILSERRNVHPHGLQGGREAEKGHNYLIRRSGEKIELPGRVTINLNPGDAIMIETPGAGGFGDG